MKVGQGIFHVQFACFDAFGGKETWEAVIDGRCECLSCISPLAPKAAAPPLTWNGSDFRSDTFWASYFYNIWSGQSFGVCQRCNVFVDNEPEPVKTKSQQQTVFICYRSLSGNEIKLYQYREFQLSPQQPSSLSLLILTTVHLTFSFGFRLESRQTAREAASEQWAASMPPHFGSLIFTYCM